MSGALKRGGDGPVGHLDFQLLWTKKFSEALEVNIETCVRTPGLLITEQTCLFGPSYSLNFNWDDGRVLPFCRDFIYA